MVTLFANTLSAPYYEHVMGSSTQQFTDAMAMAERMEQGIKSGRISAATKKRGFNGKRKEIDLIEGGYKGKNTQFPKYNPPSSQVANINFNSPFSTKRPKNQIENLPKIQIRCFPKKSYQKPQEQLPPLPLLLNEI